MGLAGSIGGVVSGLLTKGGVKAPDLSALFKTIEEAGVNQRQLINALPTEVQELYKEYKASNAAAGETLKADTAALGEKLKSDTAAIYGANAPAVQAAIDAAKTQIYSNLPAQQDAIRQALAATGGFDRGTASKQLAAPVLQAGQQFTQAVSNITADQLAKKQDAEKQALASVMAMDNTVIQQLFGMSKDQALTIMNSNRQDLKDQMTDLVNQSTQQTNQKLGVQGTQIQNQYQADVAKKAQKDAMTNAWVNLGVDAASTAASSMGGWQGIMAGLGGGGQGGYAPPSYANASVMNDYRKAM